MSDKTVRLSHVEVFAPLDCVCELEDPGDCFCTKAEKALRYIAGNPLGVKLSPAAREQCLTEIDSVEGYDRKDYENVSDADLANTVLDAWRDYARDKGLL